MLFVQPLELALIFEDVCMYKSHRAPKSEKNYNNCEKSQHCLTQFLKLFNFNGAALPEWSEEKKFKKTLSFAFDVILEPLVHIFCFCTIFLFIKHCLSMIHSLR